ncbi:aquaporin [uncultured Ruegeria sp.]|uniref:aquaporin n=1 Tax=uncultured Ruegeria sp. TaxID=259304 RepID=UPI0026362980|nr:aquaporin [uncultured Ruegeria sp.]
MNKQVAEFIGTFTLVLFGCGAAVIAGADIGFTGISFAFGLALVGMAYGIGAISGCHINPAVSLGMVVAGRMEMPEAIKYIIAQVSGAIVAALVLLIIASGTADYSISENGLGQNGWGKGYLGEYGFFSAFVFETVATFLFVVVILGATSSSAPATIAGLAIGLTLVVIHLVGINVTGVSVNPARSIGPALFSGWWSIVQLPMFIIAPVLGAIGAGMLFKSSLLDTASSEGDDLDDITSLRTERDALRQERDMLRNDLAECRSKSNTTPEAAPVIPSTTHTSSVSKPEGLLAPRGGAADDLKEIKGIGPAMERLLHSLGYYHFDQIAAWEPHQVAWVDDNLEGFKGRVTRDNWITQAKLLASKQ